MSNDNVYTSSRTSLVEPLIIRLLLTSDLPRRPSNSYYIAGRTYIGYTKEAFNLARVCKRWFKLVSGSLNRVDIDQFYSEDTDLSPLLMMIRGEQTTKQKFPIINKMQSLTISGHFEDVTNKLIETLVKEQKEGHFDEITSSLEHVYADTYGMDQIPSDFYDMLEICKSLFPSLDSLTLYRRDHQEESGSPTQIFLWDLPYFDNFKYLDCKIYREAGDNEENLEDILNALSKNLHLKYLDLTISQGVSTFRLACYFAAWSNLEYLKIKCAYGFCNLNQKELNTFSRLIRENNKLKEVYLGKLRLKEMSFEKKEGIQQALAVNKCITNLDVNYSLFYTKTKSTNIISQVVKQFKLVHKSNQDLNDYQTVTDSIIDIISLNTHPNLTSMYITFILGDGEKPYQFKQRLVDALSTNTTLQSFSYNIVADGKINPSTTLR
ncbi:hypothetical protein DLAC_07758 [Tieghemostelium lacteum]|uniref:F-box domain-containing protein n=1 Tax=Tieghemostelium lacteum TaxID=361077 RepID=A0A151ZAB6_TIELA|nr:hypothetical protein DLAC_07758 [Tieghemostelium lacteum]|eukprot:KYQ90887.1 hypothetical protein DLAC_07758 [Tieghemostelium lacteum]